MTKWSWIVQRNDPKIVKWAIGSQYNKVDPRVATVIVFVYKTRKIYSKVYQGKSTLFATQIFENIQIFDFSLQLYWLYGARL